MRYVSEHACRAPAANNDVALLGELEDLLGREPGQLVLVDLPALEERGLAFEITMDGALLHAELLGEVMLDKLVMNHCKAHLLGKACRNILSERPHLSRHCDHSHGILLSVPGAPWRERCTGAPVAGNVSI